MKKFRILFFLFLFGGFEINAQYFNNDSSIKSKWILSSALGIQMSGIKSQDFIYSNYSPLFVCSAGKWFNANLGLKLGYQGRYFYSIADQEKHFYDFYFIKSMFSLKSILTDSKIYNNHEFLFDIGFGFFQNNFYKESKIHGILGATNSFIIAQKITLNLNISAIFGWDIYQKNKDILPACSLGISYFLK